MRLNLCDCDGKRGCVGMNQKVVYIIPVGRIVASLLICLAFATGGVVHYICRGNGHKEIVGKPVNVVNRLSSRRLVK